MFKYLGWLYKKAFALFSICVASMCSNVALASDAVAPLLGFTHLSHELAINPCLSDSTILEHFGKQGVQQAVKVRQRYSMAGLCAENKPFTKMLAQWYFNSSALLANTHRPFLLGAMIADHNTFLQTCETESCFVERLAQLQEWTKAHFANPSTVPHHDKLLPVTLTPILHPALALRSLELPLPNQKEVCGSTSKDALRFYSSTIVVNGDVVAVAQCQHKTNILGTWILAQKAGQHFWSVIFFIKGDKPLFVLSESAEHYPHIFFKEQTASGTLVSIFKYVGLSGYTQKLRFELAEDAYGILHALNIQQF